ncbi:efflux RND transporter periplasmic adaptor subunit [Magnetofaba australis]|uniref:Putative RND family efflux transporter MFP subunit n=1 Tax=Magnetofaba australis IT-1 TaxID=1434232 RepID=A0A1Y2K8Y6_9PROT|nr:efflux RND transporter periplasmic adaptor subunit [Magnetofaba australis]OSM05146.1 putative RND family efflux transporter MFP subunit [Magnetofaba australis IT-1]
MTAFFKKGVIPLIILALGVAGAGWLNASRATPPKGKPHERVANVRVMALQAGSYPVVIDATGVVEAARTAVIAPELAGVISQLSDQLRPGGLIKRGELLLALDAAEQRITLQQKLAALQEAEYNLAIEAGKQERAERDWNLVKSRKADKKAAELARRVPNLGIAKQQVKSAQAAVDLARLNLKRMRLTAPFDALVLESDVALGQRLGAGSQAAKLMQANQVRVRIAAPLTQLRWLQIPPPDADSPHGSAVTVTVGDIQAEGWLEGIDGALNAASQQAELLAIIPQSETPRRLPLGAVVSVRLHGLTQNGVIAIPRAALHEGNRVWLVDADNKLDYRDVTPLWGDAKTLYVREGLASGAQVVVSPLAAPLRGVKARVQGDEAAPSAPEQQRHKRAGDAA